ncbi:hypothetical protein YC2023_015853 [Brassica napus]
MNVKNDRRVSASPPSSLVFAVRSSPSSLIIIIRWVYRFWISGAEAGACDNGLRLRSRLQRDVLRLQFMAQFCRSTIPNDFESSSHEQSHESESELLRFEDEEVEESYQRLREREITILSFICCQKQEQSNEVENGLLLTCLRVQREYRRWKSQEQSVCVTRIVRMCHKMIVGRYRYKV